MAERPGDVKLGAAGTHLMEFSHKMQQRAATEQRGPAKVIQLPLWPEATRGTPNAVLRAALFAAIQGKGRRYMREELIAAQQGIEIRYTGAQLDQADLDVWEQTLHLARTQALGSECHFTAHGFLKALGRSTGKKDHEWLQTALERLTGAVVRISDGRRTYFGTLVEGGIRDEETGRYVVDINPKLAAFYGRSRWTQIDWEQRQSLRRKPLALWLHGFYATHAEPYPLTVAYLHKLSGSRNKQLRFFKRHLTQALTDLQQVGAIRSFEVRDNLVHVQAVPSPSQQKHLAARRPPARRRK